MKLDYDLQLLFASAMTLNYTFSRSTTPSTFISGGYEVISLYTSLLTYDLVSNMAVQSADEYGPRYS